MIGLISRSNFDRHVMLRSLCIQLEQDGHAQVREGTFLKIFKFRIFTSTENVFISDDPFAFLVGLIFFWKAKKRIFWMLELGMFQKNIQGLKDVFRALLFRITTWISLLVASKIFFPSQLRKNLICDIFAHLNIKNRSSVVINIPKISQNSDIASERVRDIILAIISDYEKVAIYAGAMQEGRDLEAIVSDSDMMGLALILCGPIVSEGLAEKISSEDHVFYLGNLDEAELTYVYKNVSVGYVNYSNEVLNTKYCAPVKIWEYKRHGLYIFSNNNFGMKTEWSNLVDRFYDMPSSTPYTAISEDVFSKPVRGQSVRIEDNILSNVFAD